MTNENMLALVADIVSAQVSHNAVLTNDLPTLIFSVYGALTTLGEVHMPVEVGREPAVSIRSSLKPDFIVCLDCGASFKTLKRHLSSNHDLTPNAYRARWNLPKSYPLVAPNYAVKRKHIAVKMGLGG